MADFPQAPAAPTPKWRVPVKISGKDDEFIVEAATQADAESSVDEHLRRLTPPIPEPSSMSKDVVMGTLSSAVRLGTGPYNVARRAFPSLPALPQSAQRLEKAPESFVGQFASGVGDVAAMFAPTGLVSKGAKAIETATTGLRAAPLLNTLGRAGLEGAAMGGVTALQTGGDPRASAEAALTGGSTAAGLKGAAELYRLRRLKGLQSPVSKLSSEFGVRATRGQQAQGGPLRLGMESAMRKSVFGSPTFLTHDIAASGELNQAAQRIANDLSSTRMTTYEASQYVKQALTDADDAASVAYKQTVKDIIVPQAGKVPLDVTGPLQTAAKGYLEEIRRPTAFAPKIRDVENVNRAIGILEDFANPTRTAPAATSPLVDNLGRAIITPAKTTPKTLVFEDAVLLRSLLSSLTRSGDITIGKGKLKALTHDLHEAMTAALVKAGRADLAGDFTAASGKYRAVQEALENSVIDGIIKSDKPDTLIDVLLSEGSSKTGMDTLMKLVPNPAKQADIQRALFERIIHNASQEGILVRGSLEKALDNLGQPAIQSLFGNRPRTLAKINRFVDLVDKISLNPSIKLPASGQAPTLFGMGQLLAGGGALTGMVISGWQRNPEGLALSIAGMGMTLVAPAILAKLMTRPGAVDVLLRAAQTPAKSTAGMNLASRLASMVAAETSIDTERTFPVAPSGPFNPGSQAR